MARIIAKNVVTMLDGEIFVVKVARKNIMRSKNSSKEKFLKVELEELLNEIDRLIIRTEQHSRDTGVGIDKYFSGVAGGLNKSYRMIKNRFDIK